MTYAVRVGSYRMQPEQLRTCAGGNADTVGGWPAQVVAMRAVINGHMHTTALWAWHSEEFVDSLGHGTPPCWVVNDAETIRLLLIQTAGGVTGRLKKRLWSPRKTSDGGNGR
jgi:hypothetical protein